MRSPTRCRNSASGTSTCRRRPIASGARSRTRAPRTGCERGCVQDIDRDSFVATNGTLSTLASPPQLAGQGNRIWLGMARPSRGLSLPREALPYLHISGFRVADSEKALIFGHFLHSATRKGQFGVSRCFDSSLGICVDTVAAKRGRVGERSEPGWGTPPDPPRYARIADAPRRRSWCQERRPKAAYATLPFGEG